MSTRSLCDGFMDVDGVELLVTVHSAYDGFVEEFTVSRLLDDGKTEPYDYPEEEEEKYLDRANEIYLDWASQPFDDDVI